MQVKTLSKIRPASVNKSSDNYSQTNLIGISESHINYRQRVKARFKDQISQIISKFNLSQLVIVLDSISAFLLSNVFTVTQLVAMKIFFIERLEKKRKKLDKHALYFISPTKQNIQFILKDFPLMNQAISSKPKETQQEQQSQPQDQQNQQNSKKQNSKSQNSKKVKVKSKSKLKQKMKQKLKKMKGQKEEKSTKNNEQKTQIPQYRRIHLLFTTFIDKGLLKMMATNRELLKRIARNSLKQFYFSARILAPNLIDINMPYLGLALSKQSEQQRVRRQYICKKMIQFIANYPAVNTVRIFFKKSPNHICQNIAGTLKETVNNYLGILLKNESPNINKNSDDLTILLLDRTIDTVTPFIHSYTYQALLFDFFDINMVTKSQLKDKGSYSYQQIQNSIYDQFRYQHISKALSGLPEALEDAKGQLQSLKMAGHQSLSLNIKQLSQRVEQLRANIEKLESIWKQFKARKIQDLGELQQSLATGITSENQNTSSVKLISDVIKVIQDPNTSREQRLRLAIICISCIKFSKEDYENLLNQFNNEDKKVLKNMIAMGVSYDSTVSKSTKTITKEQQKIANDRMQKCGMQLSRYTSIIELVVPLFSQILSNPQDQRKIDKELFGQIACSIFKDSQKQRKFNKKSFAVCMLGGMSWAEVSAIRNIQQLSNIVLMTDSMMTAPQFIRQVAKINIITS